MANHGDNYVRQKDPDGNEFGVLGTDCGHHCGVVTVGHAGEHVGHCYCPECHNDPDIYAEQKKKQKGA